MPNAICRNPVRKNSEDFGSTSEAKNDSWDSADYTNFHVPNASDCGFLNGWLPVESEKSNGRLPLPEPVERATVQFKVSIERIEVRNKITSSEENYHFGRIGVIGGSQTHYDTS